MAKHKVMVQGYVTVPVYKYVEVEAPVDQDEHSIEEQAYNQVHSEINSENIDMQHLNLSTFTDKVHTLNVEDVEVYWETATIEDIENGH